MSTTSERARLGLSGFSPGFIVVLATCKPRKYSSDMRKLSWFSLLRPSFLITSFAVAMPSPMGRNMFLLEWQKSSIPSRICAILWIILHSSTDIFRSEAWYSLASDFVPSGFSTMSSSPPNSSSHKLLFKSLFSIFISTIS